MLIHFSRLVFKKIAKVVGGRVRELMSGGAPLSAETHEFIKICLCCNIIQGYGLTESTSGATTMDGWWKRINCVHFSIFANFQFELISFRTITLAHDSSFGRVGCPITACDIRLCNWDEGGYRVTNKPYPQGEIIIGGDNIAQGYFKLEQKTAEDFFDEGDRRWFKTGDIGEFHDDGVLKIIGELKCQRIESNWG